MYTIHQKKLPTPIRVRVVFDLVLLDSLIFPG